MNDSSLPPIPPEDPHNYNQRAPNEFSAGTKILIAFLGAGYSMVAGFLVILCGSYNIYLALAASIIFLSLSVISLFFKGFRFFALGASLAIVFGCLLPFGLAFVICGRVGQI